jgi:hypothetical protein
VAKEKKRILNALERFRAVMSFEPCDRTLLWEFGYWAGTIHRWYEEGLPQVKGIPQGLASGDVFLGEALTIPAVYDGVGEPPGSWYSAEDVHEYFRMDKGIVRVPINLWMLPRIREQVLAEEGETEIRINYYGQKIRSWKDEHGHPELLEPPVRSREDFEALKERFKPDLGQRLPPNWDLLLEDFRGRDYPLALLQVPYGLFWIARELMGPMQLFYAFNDDPLLVKEIMDFFTDFWITVIDSAMEDLGPLHVDYVYLPEDICYKGGAMISPDMFREFLMPNYKRLTHFFKENGIINIMMDSDGDVRDLIPLWLECGITGITPCEVASGMDIVEIRRQFPELQIVGGLSKQSVVSGPQAIDAELEYKLPALLATGGFIPTMDHMVSPDVPWDNYRHFRRKIESLAKRYGSGSVNEQARTPR